MRPLSPIPAALAATVLFLHASGAAAQSLGDKIKQKEHNEALAEHVKGTNEHCGTQITASLDWTTFNMADAATWSPSGYCQPPLDAIYYLCDSEDSKAAVTKNIKSVVCKFGGKGKRAFAFKDGVLELSIDWEAGNDQEYVNQQLLAASLDGTSLPLAESRYRKEQDTGLADSLKSATEKCGTTIAVTLDWASFTAPVRERYSVYSYCQSPLDALGALCSEHAEAKESVAKNVRSVACKFGGKDKRALSLKDGVLELTVDWDAGNYDEYIREFLLKNL